MEPASTRLCSVCGESVNAKGVCLACLLRAGLDGSEQPDAPEVIALFDDFEIERREDGTLWELGRGGMGVTYRATERTLHRSVALKVIDTHGSEAVRERFLREARAAAALRHPNVAGVFRFGAMASGDRCYCAMELVEGETLEALVRRDGPLKVEAALEIAIQVTRALIAAADRRLIHRDLKPGNIMLTPSENAPAKIEVKVIDFGLAKAASAGAAEMELTHGEFVGTPAFASPEQFAGGAIDARTDIYAFGVTLWYALTGRLPFAGRTIEEIRQHQAQGELPLEQLQGMSRRVLELLRSCLAIDPGGRPASARQLLEALESCQAQSITRRRNGKLAVLGGIAALVLGIAVSFLWRNREHDLGVLAGLPEKSIAVLPFENLSASSENAFFTDGMQDEILTDLARIADLKVISRTSVMQYKSGVKRNLRQVGKELGVAHVVEGSVQRAGNRVRVNAQLIDARTDAHLWAQTYDRDLADVFAIQSEIAKAIADQLRAKLSPSEKSAIEQPPTKNITAFELYSQAKNLFLTAFAGTNGQADLRQAADLLKQAVARDPLFFQAYCQLAFTEINLYGVVDHNPADLAQAEAALESAARLRPDAGETHLARARNLYWGYLDYDGALRELEIARESLPGEDWVFSLKGYIERRQGRWEECIRDLDRASELDPRNVLTLQQLAITYGRLRRYAEEKSTFARILAFEPDDPVTKSLHAFVELDSKADTRPLHEVTDSIRDKNPAALSSIADDWLLCALAERDPSTARKALIALGDNPASLGSTLDVRFNRPFIEGVVARAEKDDARAQTAFTAARAEQEKIIQAQPNHGPAVCVLGLIDAALGRKEEALREGRRAVELLPVEKDALLGAAMVKYLAIIATWAGEKDLACEQLAIAIRRPGDLSYGQLKLMPFWDPLRGDPRFEKILVEAKETVARQSVATTAPEKSIAVLPFENLSEEKANEYFAAGIQDEILTRLAAVRDLKVISRTSTAKYKSKPDNLTKVAQELGVSTILEGSVQKAGDKVRINVQLIRAASDSHLWAETYDRKLTDIFSVESEVAKAIVDRLQAKLTGNEEQVIAAKSTDNTEAHDAYLRGLAYSLKTANTTANALNAQKYLKEAVRLDPKFALAWALLSFVDARGYRTAFLQPTVALREEARQAAENALALQPNLGEAVVAKGFYHYACLRDYGTAVRYFEEARPLLPNSSRIPESLAYVTRKQGQWDRSESYFNEAERLDPRNVSLLTQHALSYKDRRLFPEALRKLDQILNITPDDVDTIIEKGAIAQAEGDLSRASTLLASVQPQTNDSNALETQIYQAILERRPASVIARLKDILAKPDPALGSTNGELRFWLGWAQEVSGDHTAARESWGEARHELESFLKEQPEDHILLGDLALTDAGLGDRVAAFRLAEQAMAAVPVEKDAVSGPTPIEILARVASQLGEADRAIAILQKLMTTPYSGALGPGAPLTPALLRLDPMFDPLRGDPRFQELCKDKQP
jgi:TolB-like protein/serine/threonine protein kinase/Tfp pilus assembly protein PilF